MSINWLPLSVRKGIPSVKTVYEPYTDQPYGGFYRDNMILVVVRDEEDVSAIIAHEYKHHIQTYTAPKFVAPDGVLSDFKNLSYTKAIRKYFRRMWWEMEALQFQEKYASTELGNFWLKGCVLPNRFDEEIQM